ncbi:MAG TPA: PHB depolymerase family esterase [Kofleriaceae bacterium]|nr:PHB depolymerase family esterase [Kofleriaceae bacterium]
MSIVAVASPARAQLVQVQSFGSNPGALDMYEYIPKNLPSGRPLVVVLHGCTQTANDMLGAGWDELADANQFAVVYPQQRSANNPLTCFNWAGEYGDPANMVRGQGENESIVEMVDKEISAHGIDRNHVYVVGFSAGAAFTAVMLATWPDRFAAGAIMSGVPYRCASSVQGAYNCQQMNQHPELELTPQQWGDLVRNADKGYAGPWPRVQIWHGSSDGTVAPQNQTELVKQWTNVFATDQTPDATETIGSVTRAEYHAGSQTVVETFLVSNMSHAVCVGTKDPQYPCGKAGAYFADDGMCSTYRAATFFGLVGGGGGGGGGTDTQPPTVQIVQPSSGGTVSGAVTIVVAAGDDVGVTHVDVAIDGGSIGTSTTAPYQYAWDTAALADGAHTITAIAYDAAGHMTSDDAMVTSSNAGGGGGGGGAHPDGGHGADPGGELPGCGCRSTSSGSSASWLLIGALWMIRSARRGRRRTHRA